MVKRIILIASLLLVYAFASAQTLETVFNGYLLPITHAGKSGDTLTFRGKFVNSLGQYDGTEIDTTSVVIVEDSGNCYYLPVVDIDTKGTVITASVLDNTSTLATIPDGQAAIGDLTEYKGLFPQVAGVTSTLASCIQNYNNAILDREEIPDTISQAHTFAKGTAIWDSSGTWVQTIDYARDIPVDAIVVDSISSTLFAVQYKGRFRMSNSYTVGKQLYVQPNGTYSITDTSNHIAYGYALDDTYIQIGLQDNNSVTKDYVNERSYWYPQVTYLIDETVTYGGLIYANTAATNKGERPDTSSNWAVITTLTPASISDVTNATYFIPRDSLEEKTANVGDRLIIKEDGYQYLVQADSLTGYNNDLMVIVERDDATFAHLSPSDNVFPFEAFGATDNYRTDDDGSAFVKMNTFVSSRNRRTKIQANPQGYYRIANSYPTLIFAISDSLHFDGRMSTVYIDSYDATATQAVFTIFDFAGKEEITFENIIFESPEDQDGARYLAEGGNPNWESNSKRSNIAVFDGNEAIADMRAGTANKNITFKNITFKGIYYPIRLGCQSGCIVRDIKIQNPKDGIRAYNTWNSLITDVQVDMDTLPSSNFKTKALYVIDAFNTTISNFTITGDLNVPIRADRNNIGRDSCNAVFSNFKLFEVGQTEFSNGSWVANNWTITRPKYEGQSSAYVFSFAGGTSSTHPKLNNIVIDNTDPVMVPVIGTSTTAHFEVDGLKTTGPIRFATTSATNVGISINNSTIVNPWENATYFPSSLFDYDDTGSTGNVRINNMVIRTEDEGQNNPRIIENYGLDVTFDNLSIKDEGNTDFFWMFRQEDVSGSINIRNSDFRGVSFDDFASFSGGATEANMPLNNVYLNDGTYILNDVYDAGVKKASDLTGLDGSGSLTETDYLAGYATDATGTNTRIVEIDITNPYGGSNKIRDIIDSIGINVGNINLGVNEQLKVYYPNAEATFGSIPSYGLIPIYNDNGTLGKAQPVHQDSLTDLFILSYPHTDTMVVQASGKYVFSHGLGQGKEYYLSRWTDTSQVYGEYFYDHLFTTINDTIMKLGLGLQLGLKQGTINAVNENYQAVLDYISANTLTEPSDAVKELQNNLVNTLDTAGLWSSMTWFFVHAPGVNDEDVAKLNWKNPGSNTPSVIAGTAGALTFSERYGYAVDNDIATDTQFGINGLSYSKGTDMSFGVYASIDNMPGSGNYWFKFGFQDGTTAIVNRNNVAGTDMVIRGATFNGATTAEGFNEAMTVTVGSGINGTWYTSASGSTITGSNSGGFGTYPSFNLNGGNIGGTRVWTSVGWLAFGTEFTSEQAGIINTAIKNYYDQLQLLY